MHTRIFNSTPGLPFRLLAFIFLLSLAGCFTAPKPDVSKLTCATDRQCPAGYSCLVPNQVGGCCKPGEPCPASASTGSGDGGGSPIDVPAGIDQGALDGGGSVDGIASRDSGGDTRDGALGAGGSTGTGETGAAGGAGGSTTGTGGTVAAGGVGGTTGTGGTVAAGGAGGATYLDANLPDVPADAPAADVAVDVPTVDAPGSCSVDKDCPAQSPLCLANMCAKCATDTDCVGRTGPACAPSGLCVGCTGSKYCTGAASTCDTTTNQCTGCVTRNDCSGACQACTGGVCTSIKSKDDPGACAGTCDATGACKAKQGQTCQAATDCAGGLPCADGYCCNSACSGSCQACNVAPSPGTCTTLALNAPPRANHATCTGAGATCGGYCDGSSAGCFYPSTACGTAGCSGSAGQTVYQAAGLCGSGSCNTPQALPCTNACVVALGGCTGSCIPGRTQCNSSTGVRQVCDTNGTWQDSACGAGTYCSGGSCASLIADGSSCQNSPQCANGNCSNSTCCAAGQTGCSGVCATLSSSAANCGTCGHGCPAGATCSNGTCLYPDGHTCSSNTDCSSTWCSTFYVDGDHDNHGAGSPVKLCGSLPPTGYASSSDDCCDSNVNAFPGSTYTSTSGTGCSAGGGYDYDCNNLSEKVEHGPHFVYPGNTPICLNGQFGSCDYQNESCTGPHYTDPANRMTECTMYSYPPCGVEYDVTTQGCSNASGGNCSPTMTTTQTGLLQACH